MGFLLAQNSNSSQFYISFAAVPQCDGKHVVIGTVTDGLDVLQRIGAPLGSQLALTWGFEGEFGMGSKGTFARTAPGRSCACA